jgi:predicted amidohydrolase
MRVALAQINPVLGAFKENAQKIMEMIDRAHAKKAQICVFSELTLFGYPPNDALEQEGLVEAQLAELKKIISRARSS